MTTKSAPDEHHDLVDLDDLFGVDVAGRLEHDEQAVAVALELRPLVGVDGVLDGEGVEVEGPGDVVELVRRRLVQTDPDEAAAAPADAQGVLQGDGTRPPLAVLVDGAVDDHTPCVPQRRSTESSRRGGQPLASSSRAA